MSRSWCALLLLWTAAGCAAASAPGDSAGGAASIAPVTVPEKSQPDPTTAATRQIIYRATLVLHVEDFSATEAKIKSLIQTSGGYVAQFREDRPYGAQRGGHWTVRIPVPQFHRFVEETGRLGISQRREIQADDVTEEYVDLEARLKNKQQLEARLLELVAKRTDEIKEVIAVEAELSRVREEIERMQGRLRYLADRVAMTSVDITAYERRDYRPPEATFAGRIQRTFSRSLDALGELAQTFVLVLVGITPWLVVLLLLAAPLVWWLRRRIKRLPPTIVVAQNA
jgi:hypothetical protein